MARISVNFNVITNCSIDINVYYGDFSGDVVHDINDIITDFKPQILDMVNGKREKEFITKHGHKFNMTNIQDVELSESAYDEIDNFINTLY